MLTNCHDQHQPSWSSSDQHQRIQTLQSSAGGAPQVEQCRRRGQHDHGRFACGSESLTNRSVDAMK